MKRFGSSESLSALVPVSSSKDSTRKSNQVYSREFQAMLDSIEEEDYHEEVGHVTEKKRRLTMEQVKALERNFEIENKLEPERKLKLAEDLGLQPRQVAIWFQNRRARWKTKQLEREYVALKASYESLKHKFSSLEHEKGALTLQLEELKSKLKEENSDSSESVKEEQPVSESENNVSVQSQTQDDFTGNISSDEVITDNNCLSASQEYMNWIQLSDSRAILNNGYQMYQQQFPVKLEEQNLFSTEETCNFFAVDQPPTLQYWYFPNENSGN